MALQVFSLIVLLGALIILIPTADGSSARRTTSRPRQRGPDRHMLAVWLIR